MDTHEVTGTIKEAGGAAEKTYGKIKDRVTNAISDANETSAADQLRSVLDETVEFIQDYPLQSLGAAVVIGALLGAFLRNRDW